MLVGKFYAFMRNKKKQKKTKKTNATIYYFIILREVVDTQRKEILEKQNMSKNNCPNPKKSPKKLANKQQLKALPLKTKI